MSSPLGLVSPPELRDVHEAAHLKPYLRDLWARRSYIWYVSKSELRNRQITNVLGNAWHLLNPALSIAVYYVIFGLLLKTDRGVENFILFLTVGILVFQYSQSATIDGSKSIIGNVGLMKAVKFPRAMLPLTSTITESLSMLSSFAVIYAVALLTGEPVIWQWLLLPAVAALQFVFNVGSAMVAARATTHFIDTTQILPFVFRLLLYGSGVIFSVDSYADDHPWLTAVFALNPFYCFLSLSRWCVFGGSFDWWLLLSASAWAIMILMVGFLWFRAGEETYCRD